MISAGEKMRIWDNYAKGSFIEYNFEVNHNHREENTKMINEIDSLLNKFGSGASHVTHRLNNSFVPGLNMIAISHINDMIACVSEKGVRICYAHSFNIIKDRLIEGYNSIFSMSNIACNPACDTEFTLCYGNMIQVYAIQGFDEVILKNSYNIKESGVISHVSYSSDGSSIMTSCSNGNIKKWNADTLLLENELKAQPTIEEEFYKIIQNLDESLRGVAKSYYNKISDSHFWMDYSLFYPKDNSKILIYYNNKLFFKTWDGKTSYFNQADEHAKGLSVFSFNESGNYIVSVSKDEINLWGVDEMKYLASLKDKKNIPKRDYYYATFSPDGQMIATSDYRGFIDVWSVEKQSYLYTIPTNQSGIKQLIFVEKKYIISSSNNKITIWDLKSGKMIDHYVLIDDEIKSTIFCSSINMIILLTRGGHLKSIKLYPIILPKIRPVVSLLS